MIRVLFGAIVGLGAGVVASAFGSLVTGINVKLLARSTSRSRAKFENVVVVAVFCAVFISISVAIESLAVVVAGWVLAFGLLTASWIDVHTHRLPRNLSYLTIAAGVPILVLATITEDDLSRVVSSVIGIAVATSLIGLLYWIGRGAMGTGDIRLAPAIGLYAGWISVGTVVLALVAAFSFAAIFAIALLLLKKANRRDEIPLGPFLAIGTLVAFVYSATNYGL